MSRDRDKRRIPTSAELEERGEVSPSTTPGGGGRPGLLKRLLRAGRFRVPEDVAARKHVSAPPRPDFTGIGGGSPVTRDAPCAGQRAVRFVDQGSGRNAPTRRSTFA